MNPIFADRREAGVLLSEKLVAFRENSCLVLALPRGGVPVGFEIAVQLGAPLDVFTVRKLGVPGRRELAMGAIATGGIRVLNEDVVRILRVPMDVIDAVADAEEAELRRRESSYREFAAPITLKNRKVILVDDGIATGSTMLAAIKAARAGGVGQLVVAAPVASRDALKQIEGFADEVVVLHVPEAFESVGRWYWDFTQVSDQEVQDLLRLAMDRLSASKPLSKLCHGHAI